jgi:hypothetical protein
MVACGYVCICTHCYTYIKLKFYILFIIKKENLKFPDKKTMDQTAVQDMSLNLDGHST